MTRIEENAVRTKHAPRNGDRDRLRMRSAVRVAALAAPLALGASVANGQALTISGTSGSAIANGEATDPFTLAQVFSTSGAVPLTPANAGVNVSTTAGPAMGGVCVSQGSSWASMQFVTPPSGDQFVSWVVGSRQRWRCETSYSNIGDSELEGTISLTAAAATPTTVYYWWRGGSFVKPEPEAVTDDYGSISDTQISIAGVPQFAPGAFNINNTWAWVVEPGASGSITLDVGDVFDISISGRAFGQITAPGIPVFTWTFGPQIQDLASNNFWGTIYFSTTAPFPPSGPPGSGAGLAACPSAGSCYEDRSSAGCQDAACCQTVCSTDPYCCNNSWDLGCVALAEQLCPQCPIGCWAGDVAEAEACGLDANGGCDATVVATESILGGDTVCGNLWVAGPYFDTDWYEVFVDDLAGSGLATLTVAIQTEVPLNVELHDGPCGQAMVASLLDAEPASCGTWISGSLQVAAPAWYRLRVAPGTTASGLPTSASCGVDGAYRMATTVTPSAAQPCPSDLNGDGVVDGADLGVLLASWGVGNAADLNGDGVVDGADLGILLANWGACP